MGLSTAFKAFLDYLHPQPQFLSTMDTHTASPLFMLVLFLKRPLFILHLPNF